jgi:hypothetical protein
MNKDFDLLHVHIVGFSGQQTLQNPATVAKALRHQLERVNGPGQQAMALTPLAGPVDLMFAKEVLAQEIPLVVLLPKPAHEMRKKFSGEAADEFDLVLKKATKTEVLLLTLELEAATRVAQRLVDEADVLLVVSDEADPSAKGDPAEVVAYATRRGRPVICLRESDNGITVRDINADQEMTQPQLSIEQIEKILGEAPAHPVMPEGLIKYFQACDSVATRTAPKVRRYVLNIVLANAIASIAGSVSSSFSHSPGIGTFLTIVKFGGIFLGLGIFAVLRHRQSKNHWIGLRLKAEVCRSAVATWNAPLSIEPLTADEIPELRHLMQALRYYRATRHQSHTDISLEAFKAEYGHHRLIDQYRYFQRQADKASLMSNRLTPFYYLFSYSAFVVSGISLFLPAHFWSHEMPGKVMNYIFIMVPVIAPAIASWIISWQAIESVSRKKARFVEMQRLMHQALIDLIHCHSWDSIYHVVKRAERQLLGEVLEWYAFVKYS